MSKPSIQNVFYLYLLTALILHVIPTGSAISFNEFEIGDLRLDYLLHTLVFLPWMPLIRLRSIQDKRNLSLKKSVIWLIAGILFAALCENVQIWIPYRSFNPLDLLFNISGILLGLLFFALPESWISRFKRS